MSQRIKLRVVSGGPGSPKFKTQPAAGKVMATVFWDAKDVITQEKYNNWSVLCKLATSAENHHP